MLYLALKSLLSGLVIMAVSEVSKRQPALGALVASLPLVSIFAILWLYRETGDVSRIAAHARATFWYVLPSLPLFLVFPALLDAAVNFWLALGASCLLTVCLYLLMVWLAPRLGIPV